MGDLGVPAPGAGDNCTSGASSGKHAEDAARSRAARAQALGSQRTSLEGGLEEKQEEPVAPMQWWQWPLQALILLATAWLFALIYVTFLLSLLSASTLTKTSIDPAEWQQHVTGRMWAAGLGCFLLLCTFPGMWLGAGATLPAVQSHPPLMYVWVALILLVQLATMKYVWQRPSLCRQSGQGGHTALAVQPGTGPGPKQAAQAPTVDWHDWRNWIVMSTYVFEVLQFAGLVVSGTTPWVAGLRGALQGGRGVTDGLGTLVVLGDRVVPPDAQFWLPMAVVVVYVYCCGLYIALDWDAGHPMGPVLFQFLSGSLFVTVTSSLMSQLFTTTDLARHVACAEALVFYSCTSVFVSIYRGDTGKTEVRTLPFFLGWERVAKGCMVVAFVLLEATPVLQYGIMSVVLGAYAAATLVTLPCSVPALNALRAVSALMGLWGAIIRTAGEAPGSALADTPGGRRVSYILLAAGWAVLVVGGVAALLVRPDTFAAAGKDVSREAWEGRLSAPVPHAQPKRRRASLMSFKPQQDEDRGELELTALGTTPSLTTENPLRSASRASRGRRPSQPVSV